MKNLGINLTMNVQGLYEAKYQVLMRDIKEQLNHINCIMNIDKLILKFIWEAKDTK